MIRFQFVEDHRTEYSVKRMCKVLDVNRSSYYKWHDGTKRREDRTCDDALLGARISVVFSDFNGCYGAKRITAELNSQKGFVPVNHKRVARVMKNMSLRGYTKRRKVTTTWRRKHARVFADLVNRNFTASRPNKVYVGDITYLPIQGGANMFLATVIDCYSRRLVGFAIADHMRTDLVIEAMDMAYRERGSLDGAIFHTDHGSVYTSEAFTVYCTTYRVQQSMGSVGTSADNSLAESFNATVKREVLQDRKVFSTMLECRQQVFRFCVRYNTRRRHSWCGYLSPNEFEAKAA